MDLSPRQLEVVSLVACGKQDKEVADALKISVPTAKAHLQSAMDRLGLHSRSDLTAWYVCKRALDKWPCWLRRHKPKNPFELRAHLLKPAA